MSNKGHSSKSRRGIVFSVMLLLALGVAQQVYAAEMPTITSQVSKLGIGRGQSVTDTATLSGTKNNLQGTVTFFVCGPTPTVQPCSSGGTQVGSAKLVDSGNTTSVSTTSDAFTPLQTDAAQDYYCFRIQFVSSIGTYSDATSSSTTNECTLFRNVEPTAVKVDSFTGQNAISDVPLSATALGVLGMAVLAGIGWFALRKRQH